MSATGLIRWPHLKPGVTWRFSESSPQKFITKQLFRHPRQGLALVSIGALQTKLNLIENWTVLLTELKEAEEHRSSTLTRVTIGRKIVLVSFNQPSVWGQLRLKLYSDFKWIAKILVISIFDYSALCVLFGISVVSSWFSRDLWPFTTQISAGFYLFSRLSTSLKFFRLGTTLPIDLFVNLKTFIKLLFHAVLRNTEGSFQRILTE